VVAFHLANAAAPGGFVAWRAPTAQADPAAALTETLRKVLMR